MEIAIVGVLVFIAFAAVLAPVMRSGTRGAIDAAADLAVEQQIELYRAAVRANTVCRRCGFANPVDSRFCCECGKSLPSHDREEFEGTEAA